MKTSSEQSWPEQTSKSIKSATTQSGAERTSPSNPLNNLSHNVAPTYNQPVLRQVGDRNNPGTQDVLPAVETTAEAPAEASTGNPPTSPTSPFKAKPGDLIIQSMRYCLSGLS
jgi:hypothetical protein